MRKLLWFAIGFSVSMFLVLQMFPQWPLLAVGFLLGSVSFALAVLWDAPLVKRFSLVLLGAASGLCWLWVYDTLWLQPISFLNDHSVTTMVTASEYPLELDYGSSVDGSILLEEGSYKVRVYFDGVADVEPGDRIYGEFRLRYIGGFKAESSSNLSGYGISLLGYPEGEVEIVHTQSRDLRFLPARLAREISGRLMGCFPEDTVAFAQALLLGDTSLLDYKTDTILKISGIRHVVAVSGLHVSILFAVVYLLTLKNRFLTGLISIPLLMLFAALAGFTPSVTRAGIMCLIMALSRILDREYDGATALSAAVVIMAAANPMVLSAIGFQLSVLSVGGIFLFFPVFYAKLGSLPVFAGRRDSKLLSGIRSSVSVTLSAMVLTIPLNAVCFGVISIVGILTNLLTIWVVSFIFHGIMLVCLVSLVWHGGAVFLANVCSVLIRYVLLCAGILYKLPLAAIYTESKLSVMWLIVSYLMFAFWLLYRRNGLRLGCCSAVLLILCGLINWGYPMLCDITVTALDVGQGQCILLQNHGNIYLIDCGGDSGEKAADAALHTLLSRGITYIDGVMITHCDIDHVGGLANLLSVVDAGEIYTTDPKYEKHNLPEEKMNLLQEDEVLSFGGGCISLFVSEDTSTDNENSMTVLFETETCAILVTGDRSIAGEDALIARVELPLVDILVAGHHGSANSCGTRLLSRVKPETVIISVGKDNRFGHPAPELLERLWQFNCNILRTDIWGNITIRR